MASFTLLSKSSESHLRSRARAHGATAGVRATLPRGTEMSELTLEEGIVLLTAKAAKPATKKNAGKKAASKKTRAKAAAKTGAKKSATQAAKKATT